MIAQTVSATYFLFSVLGIFQQSSLPLSKVRAIVSLSHSDGPFVHFQSVDNSQLINKQIRGYQIVSMM